MSEAKTIPMSEVPVRAAVRRATGAARITMSEAKRLS
jgi:hypothetical protein